MSNSDIIYHFFTVLLTYSILIKFNHLFEFSSQFSHQQNFAMLPVLGLQVTEHPTLNAENNEFSMDSY